MGSVYYITTGLPMCGVISNLWWHRYGNFHNWNQQGFLTHRQGEYEKNPFLFDSLIPCSRSHHMKNMTECKIRSIYFHDYISRPPQTKPLPHSEQSHAVLMFKQNPFKNAVTGLFALNWKKLEYPVVMPFQTWVLKMSSLNEFWPQYTHLSTN